MPGGSVGGWGATRAFDSAVEGEMIRMCQRLGQREAALVAVRVPRKTVRESSYGVLAPDAIPRGRPRDAAAVRP